LSSRATAKFEVKSWDEKAYSEIAGSPKLTRASVLESIEGGIVGEGTTEYVMVYLTEDSASFVRIERIVGRIGAKSGTFVLQGSGTYENGTAKGDYFVVPGSGTGDLRGLRGKGSFHAHREPRGTMMLDYEFESGRGGK
jgi:hypothetical protein